MQGEAYLPNTGAKKLNSLQGLEVLQISCRSNQQSRKRRLLRQLFVRCLKAVQEENQTPSALETFRSTQSRFSDAELDVFAVSRKAWADMQDRGNSKLAFSIHPRIVYLGILSQPYSISQTPPTGTSMTASVPSFHSVFQSTSFALLMPIAAPACPAFLCIRP